MTKHWVELGAASGRLMCPALMAKACGRQSQYDRMMGCLISNQSDEEIAANVGSSIGVDGIRVHSRRTDQSH